MIPYILSRVKTDKTYELDQMPCSNCSGWTTPWQRRIRAHDRPTCGSAGRVVVAPLRPLGFVCGLQHAATATLPFPAWTYEPVVFASPAGDSHGGKFCRRLRNLCFCYLAFGQRPDTGGARYPMTHALGFQEITALRIQGLQQAACVASPPGDGAERGDDMVCRFPAPYGDRLRWGDTLIILLTMVSNHTKRKK